ncbi:MAG: hypothetical protein JXC32_22630 [Anaerolineae bacterium]|nr:hypothetical protein [Anaerolineae bacterium]
MSAQKRLVLLGLTLVAALSVFAAPVMASHMETAFNAVLGEAEQLGIDRQWVDDEGMTRIRGQRMVRPITGEASGQEEVAANFNLDEATGDGLMWGSTMLTLDYGGRQGTFRSRFFGTVTDGLAEGWVYGIGLGDFEGTMLSASFSDVESLVETPLAGIVIEPAAD